MTDKTLIILSLLSILWGIMVVSTIVCGSNNSNPIISDPDPCPPIINSEALDQLLHMERPDRIISANILGDTLYDISTISLSFLYSGDISTPVAAVRAITIWHDINGARTYIGTSYGIISTSNIVKNPVNTLEPNETYYFWTSWDNDPFVTTNAFYTNFFVKKENSLDKQVSGLIGKSIEKAIKEVL